MVIDVVERLLSAIQGTATNSFDSAKFRVKGSMWDLSSSSGPASHHPRDVIWHSQSGLQGNDGVDPSFLWVGSRADRCSRAAGLTNKKGSNGASQMTNNHLPVRSY